MYDVITIGTATRDVFLTSPLFKVLKDPAHLKKIGFKEGEAECFAFGAKIDIGEPIFTTGGGASNAAVTFSRQGLKTAAIIALGKDSSAQDVIKELENEKVAPIVCQSKKLTAYSTILLSSAGERTILVSRGAADDLSARGLPLNSLRAKWVYIAPGAIELSVINKLVDHFLKTGAKIAMNPSGHYIKLGRNKLKPLFEKLNVVIVNRSEASRLTGASYTNERSIFQKFDKLISGIAVMTDGKNGALISDGKSIYRAGTFSERQLVDRTGAGDAFGSGFVSVLTKARGEPTRGQIELAIRLASANATSVVESIGAKVGILTAKQFGSDKRFKKLSIRQTLL